MNARLEAVRDRYRTRIAVQDSGCWHWMGGMTNKGYGIGRVADGRRRNAHRIVYEELVGPIPTGLELDHLCRNRRCVNPAHLEPVTHAENIRRGHSGRYLKSRTHCKYGHPFDAQNTYHRPGGTARGCLTCLRARAREHARARRAILREREEGGR